MTGRPTRSAPVTMASACSSVMTLKAATAWPRAAAVATISPVGVSGTAVLSFDRDYGDGGPDTRGGARVELARGGGGHRGGREGDRVGQQVRPREAAREARGERRDRGVPGAGRVAGQRFRRRRAEVAR